MQSGELMKDFLKSPSTSVIVFSDVHFTGEALKQHLIDLGKLDLVEMSVVAIMQVFVP